MESTKSKAHSNLNLSLLTQLPKNGLRFAVTHTKPPLGFSRNSRFHFYLNLSLFFFSFFPLLPMTTQKKPTFICTSETSDSAATHLSEAQGEVHVFEKENSVVPNLKDYAQKPKLNQVKSSNKRVPFQVLKANQEDPGCKDEGEKNKAQKPSSLHLCMLMNEHEFGVSTVPTKQLEAAEDDTKVWDYSSDNDASPASSWSTLPNRSLLCRPLPKDIGRCTCSIVRESLPELGGVSVFVLYTNEGQGRQDRRLAIARHRRRKGRSEFAIAQNAIGLKCMEDESFLGTMTANLVGSKYLIWDQGNPTSSRNVESKRLLAAVTYMPTVTTWTGSCRSMRAWIPKNQTMLMKNTSAQIQHNNRLPSNWEVNKAKTNRLFSKVPYYNHNLSRYELNFRERARGGMKIRPSAKNFQLTLEENGKHCVLLLARVGKSKYVMDYRFPLTGYQAFAISLSSIDSKLCCSV